MEDSVENESDDGDDGSDELGVGKVDGSGMGSVGLCVSVVVGIVDGEKRPRLSRSSGCLRLASLIQVPTNWTSCFSRCAACPCLLGGVWTVVGLETEDR
jgi:hypothetical protein